MTAITMIQLSPAELQGIVASAAQASARNAGGAGAQLRFGIREALAVHTLEGKSTTRAEAGITTP